MKSGSTDRIIGTDDVELNSLLDQGDAQNHITIIPVEYPPWSYPQDFPPGHVARDYLREKVREELRQSLDHLNNDQPYSSRLTCPGAASPARSMGNRVHLDDKLLSEPLARVTSVSRSSHTIRYRPKELEMCIYMMSGVCIRLQLEKGHQATVSQIINVFVGDEELGLPASAKEYFTLWMVSPLLVDYEMLAGLQARIELGPYDEQIHTSDFFRARLREFLPDHLWKGQWLQRIPLRGKTTPEMRVLEQFRRIPTSSSRRKLIRKYLEFCWSLPYYGSAFFKGQIEGKGSGLLALISQSDHPVTVAINREALYVINPLQHNVLLGMRYEDFSWDYARPSEERDEDCLPCLFIQFPHIDNGVKTSKILQVFSKQAVLMDALISNCVEDLKHRDYSDGSYESSTDLDGECIGTMGSWSFIK
ncbi:unnamed protein product [Darwinula stevensoni]|uniref:FERM domain-containing protein 8 n=1 Tax=Darwinula stevensoni TaxID=69355 RepID=A0A7R9AAU6_9CRUS|nr:unnamed protein product [Darwinula stevensoni]CAG0898631.1 unnamed protein product [Darwinula stevensoni]